MLEVVMYKGVVYPKDVKQSLHVLDMMQKLSQREKDLLLVFELLASARYAKFPTELTTHQNVSDLETISPILVQYGWEGLLYKPDFVEGFSTDGTNFFTVTEG